MSYDTNRTFAYIHSGKRLKLYRLRRTSSRVVDSQGRVQSGNTSPLIYPDENITGGLRIEYTCLTKPFVSEDPELITYSSLVEETSPDESSYLNLNRTLSLAVVYYVKAQMSERQGNIDLKEYYMKEFYKKISDNESNKNKVFMVRPISTFAVK
jgi:hypothetical protein